MSQAEQLDRWCAPYNIIAGANVLRLREGATTYTITITPGTYWLYAGSASPVTGYPSLYHAITAGLTAAAPGTYALTCTEVPGEGTGLRRALRLARSTSAALGWSLRFEDALWTLPPELLGYPPDQDAAVEAGSRLALTSPRGVPGVWLAPSTARSKTSYPRRRVATSTDEVQRDDAYALSWQTSRARLMRYDLIPAVYIHSARSEEESYRTASLVVEDPSLAFEEVWQSLSRLRDVIIIHDVGGGEDGLDAAAHPSRVEVVRLATNEGRSELERLLTTRYQYGEQYALDVPLVQRGGGYTQ